LIEKEEEVVKVSQLDEQSNSQVIPFVHHEKLTKDLKLVKLEKLI
jgi:hypothetical protein